MDYRAINSEFRLGWIFTPNGVKFVCRITPAKSMSTEI